MDDLQALFDDLASNGGWTRALDEHDDSAKGRAAVTRVAENYFLSAEIFRTTNGRGWVISVERQCGACACVVRVTRRLDMDQAADLVPALNAATDDLRERPYAVHQHLITCQHCVYVTEPE